jgi:uncharacterized protein with PQ loop repeat
MAKLVGSVPVVGTRWRLSSRSLTASLPRITLESFDRLACVAGVFGPLMTIPQVLKIWIDRSVDGVSFISWVAYLVNSLFFLAYGILKRDRALIVMYSSWTALSVLIIIGLVIF